MRTEFLMVVIVNNVCMKILLTIIIMITLSSCHSQEKKLAKKINILFIGNSLTYYHDMPKTLEKMLLESGLNVDVEQSTAPGMPLHRQIAALPHPNQPIDSNVEKLTATESKMMEKEWDIIIMQSGTVPLLIPEARKHQVSSAVRRIKQKVNNSNVRFIIFNTWPSKESYPKKYCYPGRFISLSIEDKEYCSPVITDLDDEIRLINEAYQEVAEINDVERTNHGSIFYKILKENSSIEILEDEFHPSKMGAFLSACIFYKHLTGKSPKNLHYMGGLHFEQAKLIKELSE